MKSTAHKRAIFYFFISNTLWYLLGSFIGASFDISEWSSGIREGIGITAAILFVLFCFINYVEVK